MCRGRHLFNIAVVFVVSGLWHGASYTFLAWGALHALAQILFVLFPGKKREGTSPVQTVRRTGGIVLTFAFVCFTYIFFRAASMSQALEFIRCLGTNLSVPLAGG